MAQGVMCQSEQIFADVGDTQNYQPVTYIPEPIDLLPALHFACRNTFAKFIINITGLDLGKYGGIRSDFQYGVNS